LKRSVLLLLVAAYWLCVGSAWPQTSQPVAKSPIKIGVLAFRPTPETLAQWRPLETVLKRAIPEHNFVVEALSFAEMESAVAHRRVDFVLTNSGHYVLIAQRYGLSAPLAMRVLQERGVPVSSYGGVIITMAERKDIEKLTDLKGKTLAVTNPNAFAGFGMHAYELLQVGIRFPKDVTLYQTGMPHDNVVNAVLSGKADVGLVRSSVLEGMTDEGKLDTARIKIINRDRVTSYPFAFSTRLYPEWPFVALKHVDEDLVRRVAAALLLLKGNTADAKTMGISGFTIPADYAPVADVLRALRYPPFDVVPPFTFQDIWNKFQWEIVISSLSLVLVIILILIFWLWALNRNLTLEKRTVQEQSHELFVSESQFRSVLENAPIGMALVTLDNRFIQVNRALCNIVGYSRDELMQRSFEAITHPDDQPSDDAFNRQMETGEIRSYEVEKRYLHKDGHVIWVQLSGALLFDENDAPRQIIKQIQDITPRKALEQQLEYQAHIDSLTGIANRGYFLELAQQELARCRRYGRTLAIAMADIDHFKHVNDTYGHQAGDIVLREFSQLWGSMLREVDLIGRVGGEEFAILFPETDDRQAVEVSNRLREALASLPITVAPDVPPLHVTISLGVTVLADADSDIYMLLKRADQALYDAKKGGRNRVCVVLTP